jgi:IS30 family transposase
MACIRIHGYGSHHKKWGLAAVSINLSRINNTNGLIRQYFPKKTDFVTISDEQVETVERVLNARPRKCLGYRCPAEVFAEAA